MEMLTYKVLLVDDEEEVMDVIEHKIDWEQCGFTVIGRAQNGLKALEIAEKMQPDVVITDIKMPYMDGMELSRRLKKENPGIRIMILTGFDEFEYAKEAVHLEIEEYVLKPVNAEELSNCMIRVKESLDRERDEKLNIQILEQYYMESLKVLQSNLMCSLIEGRVPDEDIDKFLNDYQLLLRGPVYCCVVFHVSQSHVSDGMTVPLLTMSVQREAKEKFKDNWKSEIFTYLGNVVMIAELKSDEDVSRLTDDCDWFCKWAERFLGCVLTAGIGKPCEELSAISVSYESAREAVSYRVLYGAGHSINIGDIAPKGQDLSMQIEDIQMNDLFKAIHLGVREDIENAVMVMMKQLRDNAKTVTQYNFAALEMVGHLYRFCANNYMKFEQYIGDVKNPYEAVSQMDDSTFANWIVHVALSISEELKNARTSSLRCLITEAKNIVRDDYADSDLSLDAVCTRLGVSNSYFSSVFKKETGQSFISYLTEYRMQRALRLLLETNEKSYEIAEHVGYVDANYFSYVFKRQYGMSPAKYRSEHTRK